MKKENKQNYLHLKADGYNTSFGIKISSQVVKPKTWDEILDEGKSFKVYPKILCFVVGILLLISGVVMYLQLGEIKGSFSSRQDIMEIIMSASGIVLCFGLSIICFAYSMKKRMKK